jgi:hypothetical protein
MIIPSSEVIQSYAVYGIAWNFVFVVISSIVLGLKSMFISNADRRGFMKFIQVREVTIREYNNDLTRLIAAALIFLPFYSVWINTVRMYYFITIPGVFGMVRGIMQGDNFSIVRLITYELVDLEE